MKTANLDTLEIICHSCSEVAMVYPAWIPANHLDGRLHTCDGCGYCGHVSLNDDEGKAVLVFYVDKK